MGVRIFAVGELANVVAVLPQPYREAAAYLLAKVSFANRCAFVHSHPDVAPDSSLCTIDTIVRAADCVRHDRARARAILPQLVANTVADDGRRFLDEDTARVLVSVEDAFDRLCAVAEPAAQNKF